jgi:hypothetical protein
VSSAETHGRERRTAVYVTRRHQASPCDDRALARLCRDQRSAMTPIVPLTAGGRVARRSLPARQRESRYDSGPARDVTTRTSTQRKARVSTQLRQEQTRTGRACSHISVSPRRITRAALSLPRRVMRGCNTRVSCPHGRRPRWTPKLAAVNGLRFHASLPPARRNRRPLRAVARSAAMKAVQSFIQRTRRCPAKGRGRRASPGPSRCAVLLPL